MQVMDFDEFVDNQWNKKISCQRKYSKSFYRLRRNRTNKQKWR